MSGSHNAPGHQPYGFDASRRRSLGGASPPNPFGAPSHEPPPPPSYPRSHMPPPSSPQQQQQHQQQQQQHLHGSQGPRPPFSSAFGPARELPGLALGPGHRPGSSMSISSIIGGGDTGAPNPPSQSQSHSHTHSHSQSSPSSAPGSVPPPSSHSMQPPSPRRNLSSGSRSEFQPFRRQPSPERHVFPGGAHKAPEGYGYSAASPSRSYSAHGSPELQGRQAPPPNTQPYRPMVFQGARAFANAPHDVSPRDPRQGTGMPPRPNSQPAVQPEQDVRALYDAPGARRTAYGQPEERRRTLGESHHTRPNAAELLGQPTSERDRPVTVQPVTQAPYSPPRDQRPGGGPLPPERNIWRHTVPEEAPRETGEPRREETAPMYRGYGYPHPSQGPPTYSGPGAEDMVRGRSLDHLSHRVLEQYHAPPTSDPNSSDKLKGEQLSRSLSSGGSAYGNRLLYDQHSKALLALGPEANRRTGRASPLPQAVQGAQSQPLSIGKDPSIKSEFGRMFSGLGSGLGSSTPSRQSPMPGNGIEPPPQGLDLNELRLQRVNSQNGRKAKRVKDEELVFENESVDGRGTPSGRGSKRNKHNHPGHHHHHVHHHHHHHHHKQDEEAQQPHSATTTPFPGKYPNPPPNGNTPQPSHHHHHYHAAPHHHHHHGGRPGQPAPLPSPKFSSRVHDISAVLEEAAKHPRHHLGSYLYEAKPELPKPNSALDDQFSYASKPKPMPVFERNPINCTVTCRIHRYYLKPRQRQQIVLQHHLWGARIYRDDSDPIAAAIHSGWIRGEWDDTVDVGMLDPRITAPNDPSDAADTLDKLPAAPVTPPADMELQVELLILPKIDKYEGTVEYGMSSRKSRTHDGLSFMINKIRWVEDDVGSRGQERTAAAMKRRLDASRALLSLTNGGEDPLSMLNGMKTTELQAR
ncbi:Rxt3-domain-containing protein [Aaosphaeria arxii CBS 175.79]|uniref:Rxt3-domain-containing protein n=1 Tax=Aaosphaeria arxii CBS 175.79 TaxID=1450172 RepID=A0A6A5XW00_9PLEO|nr:Rxt3-domain-containing protein [Aaosphaeria arxii CBS 175.79]KAF2017149.1 Rxt3-domain-containing protein [Aaosphaeria arxii CBS 175.79]